MLSPPSSPSEVVLVSPTRHSHQRSAFGPPPVLPSCQKIATTANAEPNTEDIDENRRRCNRRNSWGSLLDAVDLVVDHLPVSPSPKLRQVTCQYQPSDRPSSSSFSPLTRLAKASSQVLGVVEGTKGKTTSNTHQTRPWKKRRVSMSVTPSPVMMMMKRSHSPEPHQETISPSSSLQQEASSVSLQTAAQLAATVLHNPLISKQLLLHMTLQQHATKKTSFLRGTQQQRQNEASSFPPAGHVIPDRFQWASYPPLEEILQAHMKEYYQLSQNKCQSSVQHQFNNNLVDMIRQEACHWHWTFDPTLFTDKTLRDRVRCYYKTHLQNSKKRLMTMLKDPTKKANAHHLMEHVNLIQTLHQQMLSCCQENGKNDEEEVKELDFS